MTWSDVMKMQAWVFSVRFVTMTSWCSQVFSKFTSKLGEMLRKFDKHLFQTGWNHPTDRCSWGPSQSSAVSFQGPEAIKEEISIDETAEKLKLMSLVSAVFNSDARMNRFSCAPWKFVILRKLSEKTGDFEVSSHLSCQFMYGVDPHQKTSGHGSCHHFVDAFHYRTSVDYRNS